MSRGYVFLLPLLSLACGDRSVLPGGDGAAGPTGDSGAARGADARSPVTPPKQDGAQPGGQRCLAHPEDYFVHHESSTLSAVHTRSGTVTAITSSYFDVSGPGGPYRVDLHLPPDLALPFSVGNKVKLKLCFMELLDATTGALFVAVRTDPDGRLLLAGGDNAAAAKGAGNECLRAQGLDDPKTQVSVSPVDLGCQVELGTGKQVYGLRFKGTTELTLSQGTRGTLSVEGKPVRVGVFKSFTETTKGPVHTSFALVAE
jgi:hypothetical protein